MFSSQRFVNILILEPNTTVVFVRITLAKSSLFPFPLSALLDL